MKTIVIKTQAELDALPDIFSEYTTIRIEGGTQFERIIVRKARESSHVEARESSHVVAWGSSHVVAWGSSHVVAWGSSHVVAWGSSHVEARGSVSVHVHSELCGIELFAFAVAILIRKCAVKKRSKTCTVVSPKTQKGNPGWLEAHAIQPAKGSVTLFKRVSSEFKTQEETVNETTWTVGEKLTHPNWSPKGEECGAGKFHACATAYFCDEFRYEKRDDRYIAIRVAVKDLHAWDGGQYPHKIAFRAGTVLHECDRYGKVLAGKEGK